MNAHRLHDPLPCQLTRRLPQHLLLLLAGLTLVLSACQGTPSASTWRTQVVMDAGEKLGGCAAGDVLPDQPGNELVCVGASGAVYLAWQEGGSWRHRKVYQAAGELIQVSVGDVDRTRPGDEIVAVGMVTGKESSAGPGAACLIYRDGDRFQGRQVFEDKKLLHGVAILNGVPVVAGFSNKAFALRPPAAAAAATGGSWRAYPTLDLPGPGKTLVPVADGLAVACADGSLAWIRPQGGGEDPDPDRPAAARLWVTAVFDQRRAGRARVGAADDGRVICADDDGTLAIVTRDGQRNVIHKENKKLRGAVLADLDPEVQGMEAACAGYENRITVLYPPTPGAKSPAWRKIPVFESTDRFHHLIAVELNGQPGLELVACGYAGELVVVTRQ